MTERSYEEIVKHITEVMEQYVAPSVAQHGGQVNFVSFELGVVIVELSGACSGCAGSTATLKHGIEQMMTQLIPEVTAVEGIDDPFSDVDPYYMNNDPFGQAAWEAENITEDRDESNN
jgi:Fe-S cluster biogenesis protein NfuA|tara:strand:- start:305 stop:658 length:354 start_codon:yes stop_codon:yes gene_type:complete